jgi:hypothetical protein
LSPLRIRQNLLALSLSKRGMISAFQMNMDLSLDGSVSPNRPDQSRNRLSI